MGEPIIILWVLLIKPSKNYLKIIFKISYLGLPDVTDERKKFLFNFNLNYLNKIVIDKNNITNISLGRIIKSINKKNNNIKIIRKNDIIIIEKLNNNFNIAVYKV